MGNKIKPRERARVFIAYRALFVNTILIYDKNICCFLLIAHVFSRFLKLQFYPPRPRDRRFLLMQHILGLVRRCVEDYHMIDAGDTVAVGVSGGKDSLLTLTALAQLRCFYPQPFSVHAITLETGTPGQSFDEVAELCRRLDVPYTRIQTPVYQIVFEERKEKNPCSLCAKLRRGSLNTALQQLGISKIALGHHYDDAIETLLMNLLFEGRIGCFQPVTYLDRSGITQIRPLLYCREDEVCRVVERLHLPVVHNPCPANGYSRRQEVKELIASLETRYPDIKQKLFGSMQRYPLYGWNLHVEER